MALSTGAGGKAGLAAVSRLAEAPLHSLGDCTPRHLTPRLQASSVERSQPCLAG